MTQGNPSPYLKQLFNKVSGVDKEFRGFTLEDPNNVDHMKQEQSQQQSSKQKQMIVIKEQQEQDEKISSLNVPHLTFEDQLKEFISFRHLQNIESSELKAKPNLQKLNHSSKEERRRQLVSHSFKNQNIDIKNEADANKVIDETHSKISLIDMIFRVERKAKVSRYLEKKKRRIWRKNISYECRKKVADNRMRVKGKFVKRQKTCTISVIQPKKQQDSNRS